jgi:hypothetical protein
MNAPQAYAGRLRKPAEHCSLSWRSSAAWRFDLLVEQLHTREFRSTDCHEEPVLEEHGAAAAGRDWVVVDRFVGSVQTSRVLGQIRLRRYKLCSQTE